MSDTVWPSSFFYIRVQDDFRRRDSNLLLCGSQVFLSLLAQQKIQTRVEQDSAYDLQKKFLGSPSDPWVGLARVCEGRGARLGRGRMEI